MRAINILSLLYTSVAISTPPSPGVSLSPYSRIFALVYPKLEWSRIDVRQARVYQLSRRERVILLGSRKPCIKYGICYIAIRADKLWFSGIEDNGKSVKREISALAAA